MNKSDRLAIPATNQVCNELACRSAVAFVGQELVEKCDCISLDGQCADGITCGCLGARDGLGLFFGDPEGRKPFSSTRFRPRDFYFRGLCLSSLRTGSGRRGKNNTSRLCCPFCLATLSVAIFRLGDRSDPLGTHKLRVRFECEGSTGPFNRSASFDRCAGFVHVGSPSDCASTSPDTHPNPIHKVASPIHKIGL